MELAKILVLCGGKATRMHPVTTDLPKSLVRVNGRAFIDYQLWFLKRAGFKKVILCVGFLGNLIKMHVGDGKQFGLEVSYSFDGETPLGTAGSIKKAVGDSSAPFFVTFGDSYLPIDYMKVQRKFLDDPFSALMVILKNQNTTHRNNIIFDGTRILKYDKNDANATYIDYGLSMFYPSVFDSVPYSYDVDLGCVIEGLINNKAMNHYVSLVELYGVGNFQAVQKLEQLLTYSDIWGESI